MTDCRQHQGDRRLLSAVPGDRGCEMRHERLRRSCFSVARFLSEGVCSTSSTMQGARAAAAQSIRRSPPSSTTTTMMRLVILEAIILMLLAPLQETLSFSVSRFHDSNFFQHSSCRDCVMPLTGGRPRSSLTCTLPGGDECSPMELWLDLRGTAITPKMALSKLKEESPFPVNKVIVSLSGAHRAVQFWEAGDPEMMVVDENDNSLCDARDPSIQYGIVVAVDGESFVDPIPALETMSNGGWVLVDPGGGAYKTKERHEAISNLVDFIAGGLSLGSEYFSLELNTTGTVAEDSPFVSDKGGIAIICQTKADLMQAANALRSIDSGALTATESGILLKCDPTESSSSLTESIQSALVLPFDTPLWKAAILVLPET